MDQETHVIVLADDEETWFCLESAWLGYPSEEDWVELEELGAKPKHLEFRKESLALLLKPNVLGVFVKDAKEPDVPIAVFRHADQASTWATGAFKKDRVDVRELRPEDKPKGLEPSCLVQARDQAAELEQPKDAALLAFDKWAADNDLKDDQRAGFRKVWQAGFAAGRHNVLGDLNPEDER